MSRRARRWCAVAFTVWLVGWVPSIVYTRQVWPGAQLYAWWIVLLPTFAGALASAALACGCFYAWALAREPDTDRAARIERLERELGIR